MARASVKKEERRDSEHDAICAWLVRLVQSGEMPPILFEGATKFGAVRVEEQVYDLHGKLLGFADLILYCRTEIRVLIEVKSSKEQFSAGDVIRQMKSYMRASPKFNRAVLVSACRLDESARLLLELAGIHVWQLDWSITLSHTT